MVYTAAKHLLVPLRADLERWSCVVVEKPFDLDEFLAASRERVG